MEKVDQVIINQLKILGCIDNGITKLQELDKQDIINCTIRCLNIIDPKKYSVLYKLRLDSSTNMAARYRVANELAAACGRLGYKGKLEYQVFLYGSLNEIRNFLLFLAERASREDVISKEETISDRKDRRISHRFFIDLQRKPWSMERNLDDRDVTLLWSTRKLNSKPLVAPRRQTLSNNPGTPPIVPRRQTIIIDTDRSFFGHVLSLCEWNQLSIIARGNSLRVLNHFNESKSNRVDSNAIQDCQQKGSTIDAKENAISRLQNKLDSLHSNYALLASKRSRLDELDKQIELRRSEYAMARNQIKSIDKLRAELTSHTKELHDYHIQWKEAEKIFRGELEDFEQKIKVESSHGFAKYQSELNDIMNSIQDRKSAIELNNVAISKLTEKVQSDKFKSRISNSRSAYVEQVMDILGQVKKQKNEIDKVINETRRLQKEINSLSGRLQRSFLLAEESIFRGTQNDDWSRRCYKLLACMHEACDDIMQATRDVGETMRENLQVEDTINTEKSKGSVANLVMVLQDLQEIKKENAILMQYVSGQPSETTSRGPE